MVHGTTVKLGIEVRQGESLSKGVRTGSPFIQQDRDQDHHRPAARQALAAPANEFEDGREEKPGEHELIDRHAMFERYGVATVRNINTVTKTAAAGIAGQGLMGVARDTYKRDGVTHSFVAGFADLTKKYKLGKPLDPATNLGPMVRT